MTSGAELKPLKSSAAVPGSRNTTDAVRFEANTRAKPEVLSNRSSLELTKDTPSKTIRNTPPTVLVIKAPTFAKWR